MFYICARRAEDCKDVTYDTLKKSLIYANINKCKRRFAKFIFCEKYSKNGKIIFSLSLLDIFY